MNWGKVVGAFGAVDTAFLTVGSGDDDGIFEFFEVVSF